MDEKNSDQIIMIPSSISLLQERFRQLQKEKEVREGRELLRSLMEYEKHNISPKINSYESYDYEPHKLFFKSEILKPSPPPPPSKPSPCNFTMSVWPDSQIINQTKVKGFYEARETMTWQTTFKPSAPTPLVKLGENESDVDTSLHL